MIKWICNLAISIPSDFLNVFDVSLEILRGDTDIAFILIPFILYKYLQESKSDQVHTLAKDINQILTVGSSLHKMIFINAFK